MASNTSRQLPNSFCRNSRIDGYQGVSDRSEQPAPIRNRRERQPNRSAQGARQVADCGVAANDEIDVLNDRGRVHERAGIPVDTLAEIHDRKLPPARGDLLFPGADL